MSEIALYVNDYEPDNLILDQMTVQMTVFL